ncbi:apolipoprotein N-acyltransferase [Christiangramia sabulilitoris]|uniref:Apolipoprotein N-acyltransferase n=1 Tax=Christiangramia sabulilitoris TaxID=2583991 RepID=A0A550HYW9_9FLAO|nr:apolipoprotein N-acyltransferase [Christiangramia sabulilitoris]TRO63890.1 apolipoprotein N-acyltransferase [Christiangramia sabulilitoris]
MKNLLYAILSGILFEIAWPTYGFPLFIFFALVPLLLAEFRIRNHAGSWKKLKVFALSYLSFFIWNLITTYWIYFSTPFGGVFAILANSLLMTLVFLLYHIVAKRTNFTAASAFLASIWMVFEKIHLNWDFSWPWLNLGNVFSEYISWVQWYEYTGTFGGSLWVLLVNIAVFKAILQFREYREKTIIYRSLVKISLFILLPIGISLILYYSNEEPREKLEVVILQPNINPYTEKYNTTDTRIGRLLLQLSKKAVTDSTSLVIAPETVFADGTQLSNFQNSEAVFFGRQIIRMNEGLNFLGGISMYDRFQDPDKVGKQSNQIGVRDWYDDYNSAFLIRNIADTSQLYHKSKLVVGVENFPYQSILKPILGDIMIDLGGTVAMKTTQDDREVLWLNNDLGTAPIICYESVYGEYVTGYVENGASFLSIITNDAWWGNTQGHRQHLSYARLRAVENRRYVARSANTGISAIINSRGDIVQSLGYEKQGSITGQIGIEEGRTFYVRYGDYIPRIAQFLALFIFLFSVVKYQRKRPS